ncbi:site-2 protease family protein [Methanofervidicoccus sp. A16]|uniref:site-2 protease family protein n=1 Tax=Methanofervidicoccus sp. A16 TaxID=2607662 RepID=UPI00118B2246|nr:site-2 protease family protein [Methanofervidicoccus sp. A16]AXI24656.1 site-2 protease family protein [Methanofervidicoccus sp. A16]MBW9220291.1 site-2 protease family protein [Methanothermococcus sp. SCGC AD-155-N22]
MLSFRIAKVMNIPIELHITFILLLILVYYFWGLDGLILYIFLFASVVVHELAHSYVAKRYGVYIEKILLLPIGGMAMMDKIPKRGELKIAIAGPIVSILLGIILISLSNFIKGPILNIGGMNYPLLTTVGILNIFLGAFNLLPAFPMDGGRILRALLASKMDYIEATKIASVVGQYFSFLLLLFGILSFNIILILIALFIYYGATQEYHALVTEEIFNKIKAKDIMNPRIVSVSPKDTVKDLVYLIFKYRYMGYPVVEDGKLVGTVSFNDITTVSDKILIKDIMKQPVTVPEDATLNDIIFKLGNDDRVYVLDKNNRLKGIISKTDVLRILRLLKLKDHNIFKKLLLNKK